MALKYPVVMYQLEKGDEGFDKGATIRLIDLHEEAYFFKNRPAAERFMKTHGIARIDEKDMLELRKAIAARKSGAAPPDKIP